MSTLELEEVSKASMKFLMWKAPAAACSSIASLIGGTHFGRHGPGEVDRSTFVFVQQAMEP